VSHTQYECSSLLRFAEERFSLRPLTERDRLANDLLDTFDFHHHALPPLLLDTHSCPGVRRVPGGSLGVNGRGRGIAEPDELVIPPPEPTISHRRNFPRPPQYWHGTLLAPAPAVRIGRASPAQWRLTRHQVGRTLRIAVLAMLCALAWFNVFAPERVESMFRPPPRETPDLQRQPSLPMKGSIIPPRSAHA
jgi:hypothetical protein